MMHAELQATCSALGYLEEGKYYKEADCLETVKDLIRFLKREDENCDIRRQLGHAQILQNDLIPILKEYKDDRVLWETVIRLMVNLTQPAVLCFQNHIPEDKTTRNYYMEIEGDLQTYKEAFVDETLFAVLAGKLGELLQLDWEGRQEEDRMLIERILLLVRNVLHIPPNEGKELRTDDDASLHDQVLWSLHVSGMEDMLLYLASSDDERSYAFHVLEIISLMFREQSPEQLASAGVNRSATEKERDERELLQEREKEKALKKSQVFKNSARHSRFVGTYVLSNVKSISDRDLIFHKPVSKVNDLRFDDTKKPKKRPKNRRPLVDQDPVRRSTLSIRMFLKDFCIQFVENCYNPLMAAVKDTLVRERAQENDETYYLWAMRFFMEFQRLYSFRVDFVSETLSKTAFHYIQTHLQNFHEMILSNKKEAIIWSRRLHLALKAYSELLQNLLVMDKSKDPAIRNNTHTIKSNVFYMMEYREVFVILLKKFDECRQSRTYLKDLVECTHLFLKMLDSFCKSTGRLIVQRKKKRIVHKKKTPKPQSSEPSPQELEDQWDATSSDLSALLQGRGDLPQDVAPFDAASEVDVDQQRAEAMVKIQDCLRENRAGEAVATFRAAREVWPEREEFGSANISPEEEFMAMREVFFADLPRSQPEVIPDEEEQPEIEEEENEEIMAAAPQFDEGEFNFTDFFLRFANSATVCSYVTLLADWRKNSVYTNHCIVKMLHRFAFDRKIPGLLFQARLFRIFQKLMTDPVAKAKQYQELYTFAKFVVRRFFDVAETNPHLFMELFFWKSAKDALEITDGYGSTLAKSKAAKVLWTEEQEMEITRLAEQFEIEGPDEVRGPGIKDLADYIVMNLIDQTKTRRQVVKQLIRQNLIGSAKDLAQRRTTRGHAWNEQDEIELRELVAKFKDSKDPCSEICNRLSTTRSKPTMVKKCLELGLIQDRKELHMKRGGGGGGEGGGAKRGKKKKKEGSSRWHDKEDELLPTTTDTSDHDSDGGGGEGGGAKKEKKKKKERTSKWHDKEDELLPTTTDTSDHDSDVPAGGGSTSDSEDETPSFAKNINKLANQMRENGFGGCVLWIQETLKEVADDREADNDTEPISVVPLTEETETAMDNTLFQKLLKRLGVAPPANEQESYWRVPGHLSPADLRSRAAALDANADLPDEPSTSDAKSKTTASRKEKSDINASRRQKLEAIAKQRKKERMEGKKRKPNRLTQKETPTATPEESAKRTRGRRDESSSEDENLDRFLSNQREQEEEGAPSTQPKKNSAKKRRVKKKRVSAQIEDSSSDDDVPLMNRLNHRKNSAASPAPPPAAPAKRAAESDSDTSAQQPDSQPSQKQKQQKRARIADSESDGSNNNENVDPNKDLQSFPATMLSVPLGSDSDSDLDDHIPLKRAIKARIASDSE